MGRDLVTNMGAPSVAHFYSHALVGRDRTQPSTQEVVGNFYSHALVGRDSKTALSSFGSKSISTHTPSWGVTKKNPKVAQPVLISTHTPSWGVTTAAGLNFSQVLHFYSHALVGRDGLCYLW